MADRLNSELKKRFVNPLLQVDIKTGKLLINRLDDMDDGYYGYYQHVTDPENEEVALCE